MTSIWSGVDRLPGRAATGSGRSGGFTLVEMLIALALLSLLMLTLTGALTGIGAAERRVDARLEAADDVAIAERFLQQVMGTASARNVVAVNAAPNRAPSPWYQGSEDTLTWVGVMPGGYGGGGRHFLQLAVEQDAQGGRALTLRRAPWTPDNLPPNWSALEPTVLLRDVSAFRLRYWDGREHTWLAQWPGETRRNGPDLLPEMLEVRWAAADQDLPTLNVRVRPMLAGDPSATGIRYGPPPR